MFLNGRSFLALLSAVSLAAALPSLQERDNNDLSVHTGRLAPTNFGKTTGCGNQSKKVLNSLDTVPYAGVYLGRNRCGEWVALQYKDNTVNATIIETTAINPDNIISSNAVFFKLGLDPTAGGKDHVKWQLCDSDNEEDCPSSL